MAFGDSATLIDDFNRADEGPPPSASWSDLENGIAVSGNAGLGTHGSQWSFSAWNAATFGDDVEAYLTMTQLPTAASGVLVAARMTTLVIGTVDCYHGYYTDGSSQTRAYRMDNGSFTQLGSGDTASLSAGDKLGLECIGSAIKVYYNTGSGWTLNTSETDATYGSAGYAGARIFTNSKKIDDFYAGTIAGAGGANPKGVLGLPLHGALGGPIGA